MKKIFFKCLSLSLLCPLSLSYADEKEGARDVMVSVGADTLQTLHEHFSSDFIVLEETENRALIELSEHSLPDLSEFMHSAHGRCGGFMFESQNFEKALESFATEHEMQPFTHDLVKYKPIISSVINRVSESAIRDTILHLSKYQNRLYKSQTGVASQEWVGKTWLSLARNLPEVDLQFVTHTDYPQKSVILTIRGETRPDEIVIVGGHGDSIAGWNPSHEVKAPGADDNASGIASITEALRIFAQHGKRPARTLQFMAYAAEEVGLRGSQDIAASYRQKAQKVVGVLQLDMTNYTRRANEIVLITDHTNAQQNNMIRDLIQMYLSSLQVKYDACGYACSDHASWNRYGYPASIPFESRMSEYNQAIHTAQDTLDRSQNRATHASQYSKIALAYIFELAME